MVASHDWSLHLIRSAGGTPEQRIAASLIVTARAGCESGDADDCRWLESCGAAYLSLVCPSDVDELMVLERLLAGLPEPDRGWRQDSQQFIQMVLAIPVEQEGRHDHGGHLQEMRIRAPTDHLRDPQRRMETAAVP